MELMGIHTLIGILIAMDLLLFGFVLLLLKRSRSVNLNTSLSEEINTFESLVREADNTAAQFSLQLQEKHRAVELLNNKLDKRIHSLNLLVGRADAAIARYTAPPMETDQNGNGAGSRQTEILALSKQGLGVEEIARKLAIQRGEVNLVLNMQ
jgi:DNA-binding NarL/FixJ family response regulator